MSSPTIVAVAGHPLAAAVVGVPLAAGAVPAGLQAVAVSLAPAPLTAASVGDPVAATASIPGQQGPPGASFSGFGDVSYTQSSSDNPVTFAANTRTQLMFVPDPLQTIDELQDVFAGHLFWDGSKVIGRAFGDVLELSVNLLVVSQVAGGKISLEVDVGSTLGSPITTKTASLLKAAGATERVTLETTIRTRAQMLANGAALYITATVPISVTRESVAVFPQSVRTAVGP